MAILLCMTQSCRDWGDTALKEAFIRKTKDCSKTGEVFCMKEITPFDWERMYFVDGTNDGRREEQVTFEICGEGFDIDPFVDYVIFLSGTEVVNYFTVVRDEIYIWIHDCIKKEMPDCWSEFSTPESACYRIEQEIKVANRKPDLFLFHCAMK